MATDAHKLSQIDLDSDLIVQIGALAFATRLKRIAERLQKDISLVYKDLDVSFESRWFPVLFLLKDSSPQSVTDMARALGLTHPAVNQITVAMARRGLVDANRDSNDERRRLVFLTEAGEMTARTLTPVWNTIQAATEELIEETGFDVLTVLERIESALERKSIYDRVNRRLPRTGPDAVQIVEYRPEYRDSYRLLNEEWLRKYFKVEPTDEEFLADPEGRVIAHGGAILFARRDDIDPAR